MPECEADAAYPPTKRSPMAPKSAVHRLTCWSADARSAPCAIASDTACAPANTQNAIQAFAKRRATPMPLSPSPYPRLSALCGSCKTRVLHPLRPQALGHQESKFQRLVRVEPRIAMRVIAARQIFFGNGLRAAQTLGHVLTRHLEMHAARMRAFGAMHIEEGFQ